MMTEEQLDHVGKKIIKWTIILIAVIITASVIVDPPGHGDAFMEKWEQEQGLKALADQFNRRGTDRDHVYYYYDEGR